MTMEKAQRILLRAMTVMGMAIFLVLTMYAWRYTKRIINGEFLLDEKDSVFWNLSCVAGVLCGVFLLNGVLRRASGRALHLFALCASCLVAFGCLVFVKNANAYPIADSLQIYLAADALYTGETEWMRGYEYFIVYPFQLGLAGLYSLFFRCAGKSGYFVIQSLQAVAAGFSVYAGFRITRELFHSRQAETVCLSLELLFCPLYLYTTYIYGEIIGSCFCLYAILFFLLSLRERTAKSYVYLGLTAVFLAVAYLARSALLVVWIAMMILRLLILLREKRILPVVLTFLLLPFMLLTQRATLEMAESSIGTDYGDGCPLILWIVMGAQDGERGQGTYNAFNIRTYADCDYDAGAASEIGKRELMERLRDWRKRPGDMAFFFKEKVLNQWIEPTYGAIFMTGSMQEPAEWIRDFYDGKYNKGLRDFLDRYQSVCYLALLGYFAMLFVREGKESMYLPGLILLGGFCFSVLWEAKSRYVFPYILIALPCAAGSVAFYAERLQKILRTGPGGRNGLRGGEKHVQAE